MLVQLIAASRLRKDLLPLKKGLYNIANINSYTNRLAEGFLYRSLENPLVLSRRNESTLR